MTIKPHQYMERLEVIYYLETLTLYWKKTYSKTINPPNQAQRAANLVNSSLKFAITLRNETLKPDVTPKNGNALTMKCYMDLFGTTREPEQDDRGFDIRIKNTNTLTIRDTF